MDNISKKQQQKIACHYTIKFRKIPIYTSNKALDKPITSDRVIWISKYNIY